MAGRVKRTKINFKGKMVNIGIDVHKRSWRITALVQGDIVMAITLSKPTYDAFKKVFVQFKGNLKWYSRSGHSEKHVIRTSFKEVSNDPKTKTIFKAIQGRCS